MSDAYKLERPTRSYKVLFVAPLAHLPGHAARAAITETDALSRLGHRVTLLTFAGLLGGEPASTRHVSVFKSSEARLSRFKTLDRRKFTSRLLVVASMAITLAKAVELFRRERFDLIQVRDATGLMMSFPQALGCLFKRTRWILSLLSVEEYVSISGGLLKITKPRWVYSLSIRRSSYAYLCHNEGVRKYYSDKFLGGVLNGKVYLLPLVSGRVRSSASVPDGSAARALLGIKGSSPIMLSFGALHVGKDIETVFRAFASLPQVILLHVGATNPKYAAKFDALRKEYSSSNIVVHDAYVSEEEKSLCFAAASAIVLSYTPEFSGSPSMLWEACSYGLPVIAGGNKELTEMVEEFGTGLVFRCGDFQSLRSAVQSYTSLPQAGIDRMKRNCVAFCDTYSGEQWAQRCTDIYRELEESSNDGW